MQKGLHLTETLGFFIFEVPKVLMLLILIVFFVGIIRTYFTPEKTRKILELFCKISKQRTFLGGWDRKSRKSKRAEKRERTKRNKGKWKARDGKRAGKWTGWKGI